jgi:hypothetical protein
LYTHKRVTRHLFAIERCYIAGTYAAENSKNLMKLAVFGAAMSNPSI